MMEKVIAKVIHITSETLVLSVCVHDRILTYSLDHKTHQSNFPDITVYLKKWVTLYSGGLIPNYDIELHDYLKLTLVE